MRRKTDAGRPAEKPARTRGRPKLRSDDESREQIITCAYELFLERGYAATSTNDIAAHCQMSKRTFYRLFPSKNDLFSATVVRHRRSMMVFPPHDRAISLEEQLAIVFQVDLTEAAESRRARFIHMAIEESRQFPELGQILVAEGADKTREELAEWLAAGKTEGLLDIGCPITTARILMDLVFGAAALKTGRGTEWPGGFDRPAFMRACIDIIAKGIAPR